jgi:hypothetical protein
VLSHLACFFLSSGIFDGEALYLSFLCTDYILPPFQLKAKDSYFEIIRFFAEKQNVFRHRIFYAFQEYPLFQSATKSSFLDLCYSSRCHVHKTNKPQVGRSHPTRSLFWLGQYRTILSADTAAAARHLRCHLIAPFLPVHGLQRHRISGL